MPNRAENALIQELACLLNNHGEHVLNGSRVLTLETPCLQMITHLMEQLFPRMPGSGFQALPSHPSDSISVLQTQFLLDVFQKAPSLKLIHPPGSPSQSDVNIFPFKALKCLELRFLPPHCLRGLRSVYSRLEVLICFRCLTSLAEIISLCGGDLTSALVWLELRTLNFSYNRIGNLDSSLELLNSLKVLDLSHNVIKDTESYLKVLEELRYLNLGYNLLIDVPELSASASETLQTLILRHNQLSTTSGIEQLTNLQHLDLSFNLLHDHRQLQGLTRLHHLRKLFLEGNPLYFHKDHLTLTSQYLSPRALNKMLMEGYFMLTEEITKREVFANQQTPISTNDNSCNLELTETFLDVVNKVPLLPRKKSKIKVRTASISEPSDSDYERRPQKSEPVLRYQKVIEQTERFRERYGDDWLQYRDHLGSEQSQDDPDGHIFLPAVQSPLDARSFLTSIKPLVTANPKSPSSSPELPKSALEVSPDPPCTENATEKLQEEEEDDYDDGFSWGDPASRIKDEEIVDPLSPLVVVCPVKDGRRRDWYLSCMFMRLNHEFLFEIDLEEGAVLCKRYLYELINIQTSVLRWTWKEEEQEFPLLTLNFNSPIEDLRKLQYVVLDDNPEVSAKLLYDVLQSIAEENLRELACVEAAKPRISYRCLKCMRTFGQEELPATEPNERKTGDSLYSIQEDYSQEVTNCPFCTSVYVFIVPPCDPRPLATRKASDPTVKPSEVEDPKSSNSEEDTDSPGTGSSSTPARSGFENRVLCTLDRVRQALKRTSFSSGTGGSKSSSPSPPSNSEAADSDYPPAQPWNMSPDVWGPIDFKFVDHRLRFYLDFNIILEDKEEYRCCIKVPVIRFGKASDFSSVVVISNQKIYFLEIFGELKGSYPANWVKPGDAHNLASLTHLHIGLNKQTLRLGFDGPRASYTLLIGNPDYSTKFCEDLLETLTELPPEHLKNLVRIPEEVVTPQHPIWPLLCAKPGAEITSPPEYLYLAVSFLKVDVVNRAREELPDCDVAFGATLAQRAAAAKQVSLLITHNHAYILEETHQWLHTTAPPEGSDSATGLPVPFRIKEKESMDAVCAVHLFPSEPRHFHIRIDNERTETAWLLWTEDKQMPNVVAEFIKAPWEALFKVSFDKAFNDNLNCCTPIPKQE